MKKWEIINKFTVHSSPIRQAQGRQFTAEKLIKVLLENRGLKTKKEIEEFINPKLENVTISPVGISKKQLERSVDRIKKAIQNKEQIVVYGDYDVDGICGAAILWETLRDLRASTMPYIPHRIDEGYGLSIQGIDKLKTQNSKLKTDDVKLIITVDNGIVATQAVDYANKNGIDVIITDHHVPSKKLPKAYAIVHTTKLCGTGVAWILCQELKTSKEDDHLGLVALATVADLVPLVGFNRTLLKFGLEVLQKTRRVGLLELFKEAGIDQKNIDVYQIGHSIAPRLNAMGRLEYAMESLRLLCTKDTTKAKTLAEKLGSTNRERQSLTEESSIHAISEVRRQKLELKKLIFIAHKTYQQGVIGLIAGKLVEEFYRPAIVVSKGGTYSKASARSVHGFNIIEFIRSASELLVNAGGHPMAAGFTIETEKISLLQKALEENVEKILDDNLLTRTVRIDCELPFPCIDTSLFKVLQKLAPFGMRNPEPTFITRNVRITDMRLVGREGKHLKLRLTQQNSKVFEAIAFGMGERSKEVHVGDGIDVVYTIDENVWNGDTTLQVKIKDLKKTE